jgi:voltage-gated potassium channel
LVAAISVAALLIPESMGTRRWRACRPSSGLYAAPLGLVGYALFGGSRLLVFGAAGSVAAVSASVVSGLSPDKPTPPSRARRDGAGAAEIGDVLSALMMFRRFGRALRHAWHGENFKAVLGAAVTLIVVGTLAYTLGEGWNIVDGFYFAIATLTTSSIADPDLVITSAWLKVFTVLYILVGIGILVELARQLGVALIQTEKHHHAAKGAATAAAKYPADDG